jgi:hypothetical protein
MALTVEKPHGAASTDEPDRYFAPLALGSSVAPTLRCFADRGAPTWARLFHHGLATPYPFGASDSVVSVCHPVHVFKALPQFQ